jgi:hypothetical protein
VTERPTECDERLQFRRPIVFVLRSRRRNGCGRPNLLMSSVPVKCQCARQQQQAGNEVDVVPPLDVASDIQQQPKRLVKDDESADDQGDGQERVIL